MNALPPTSHVRPVALVTGAAGGLGTALVQAFSQAGWQVFAGVHRQPGVDLPDGVEVLPLDVTDVAEVNAAVQRIESTRGRLDLLVNNAGLSSDALLARTDAETWERIQAVNLDGVSRCIRAFLPMMVRQSDGQIVNLGSYAARGSTGKAAYAAAKAGVLGLTLALAREVGPHNVRVNAVLPGVLLTAMTRDLAPQQLAAFAAANALGRLNEVGEVARFIVHLASTRNISGQIFNLDSRPARWA